MKQEIEFSIRGLENSKDEEVLYNIMSCKQTQQIANWDNNSLKLCVFFAFIKRNDIFITYFVFLMIIF